jgi:hypothetical protein
MESFLKADPLHRPNAASHCRARNVSHRTHTMQLLAADVRLRKNPLSGGNAVSTPSRSHHLQPLPHISIYHKGNGVQRSASKNPFFQCYIQPNTNSMRLIACSRPMFPRSACTVHEGKNLGLLVCAHDRLWKVLPFFHATPAVRKCLGTRLYCAF